MTSFDAAAVPADELSTLLYDYWAIENLRTVRREFLPQLAILTVVTFVLGVTGVMSLIECSATIGVMATAAIWLLGLEVHRERRFLRQLEQVPGLSYSADTTGRARSNAVVRKS